MHIAFAADDRYTRMLGAVINSIVAHNDPRRLAFHVVHESLSRDSRERLRSLAASTGAPISLHDAGPLHVPATDRRASYVSTATYLRLEVPRLLVGTASRVLYLDSDILCFGDLSPLEQFDVQGAAVAAVPDKASARCVTRLRALGVDTDTYFNAGVLWIDVDAWVGERVTERTQAAMRRPGMKLGEQDALNVALASAIATLDWRWNYPYKLIARVEAGIADYDVPADARLVHFLGKMKPWKQWNPHASRALVLRYERGTPWEGTALDNSASAAERRALRRYRRHEATRQGDRLTALSLGASDWLETTAGRLRRTASTLLRRGGASH